MGPGCWSGAVALRGVGELRAGMSCGWGAGALLFAGSGSVVGQVGPLGRRQWGPGGPRVVPPRIFWGGNFPAPHGSAMCGCCAG